MQITITDNNLTSLNQKIEFQKKKVSDFFISKGFTSQELNIGVSNITDTTLYKQKNLEKSREWSRKSYEKNKEKNKVKKKKQWKNWYSNLSKEQKRERVEEAIKHYHANKEYRDKQ